MLYEWCLDLTGQSVSRYNNAPVPATTQRGVYFPEHVKYHTYRKSASVLFQHTLKATLQSNDTKTKKNDFFVDYFLNKIAFNRRNFFVRENRIESRKNFKPTFIIFFFANKETHTIVTVIIILDQRHQMQLLGVGAQHGYNSWGDHN